MKTVFNRTAVTLFKAIPVRAARHLLFLARGQHATLDRWGYHIRPVHYYEPIPDFRLITDEKINRRRDFPAMNLNWQGQLDLIGDLVSYQDELEQLSEQRLFDFSNGFFGGFDAAAYYALIRHLKPRQVLEVGGGYSTLMAEKALAQNRVGGSESALRCIEPYPEPRLTDAINECELIVKQVQDVSLELFSNLDANDILFIDSSHTVKFGSDVNYLFLEVLPELKPGVWVHVHDIFFPNDYPAEWLLEKRLALNEQYLLEAFLTFNTSFSIRLANHWLCLDYSAAARALQPPSLDDAYSSSSFWFQRVAAS